jgi:hypothetical protein
MRASLLAIATTTLLCGARCASRRTHCPNPPVSYLTRNNTARALRVAGQVRPCGWRDTSRVNWCIGAFSEHGPQRFARPDVDMGTVSGIVFAVVELLPRRTVITVTFGLIREPLGTVERTFLSVDTVARPHIRSDAAIRQPEQKLPVPIGRVGRYRFWCSFLPLVKTSKHVLRGSRFLTHPCFRRLHPALGRQPADARGQTVLPFLTLTLRWYVFLLLCHNTFDELAKRFAIFIGHDCKFDAISDIRVASDNFSGRKKRRAASLENDLHLCTTGKSEQRFDIASPDAQTSSFRPKRRSAFWRYPCIPSFFDVHTVHTRRRLS